MYLLNYLYFIIITGFGIKFLFQRAGKVRHPLNKEQMLSFDGGVVLDVNFLYRLVSAFCSGSTRLDGYPAFST